MNETKDIYLSVIIPAFNEAFRISSTLTAINTYLKSQPYKSEIIVVDDCSVDSTYDVVRNFSQSKSHITLVRNIENVGKGASVRRGMLMAKGHYRLFTDADNSTPIEEVEKLLNVIARTDATKQSPHYDIAIGSRRVEGAHIVKRQPMHREGAGRIFSVLVRLLTVRGFLDTQCGFKLFSADAAQNLFSRQTIPGFGFDVELLYIARNRFGYHVKEVPVTWIDSPATRVQLYRDSMRMFTDLLLIRWRHLTGRYR